MIVGVPLTKLINSGHPAGESERFRKWGYKFVRTLYNVVVKVVCLKF